MIIATAITTLTMTTALIPLTTTLYEGRLELIRSNYSLQFAILYTKIGNTNIPSVTSIKNFFTPGSNLSIINYI